MTKIKEITMPSLGADMTEGKLVEWLVTVGEQVHNGQVIAVLETQKGAIDMEVYDDGIVTELLIKPVKTVPVGTALAMLALSEKKCPEQLIDEHQSAVLPGGIETQVDEVVQNKHNVAHQQTNVLASPVAKSIAKDNNIDLSIISGSGPQGAVLLKDLELIYKPQSTTVLTQHAQKPSLKETSMRTAISASMVKSKQTIPHFYLSTAIDVNKAQQWIQRINHGKSAKDHILLIALLLKAVALTLKKFPQLNGFYLNNQFKPSTEINIANVISLRTGGVVVPALSHVEQLSVTQIMATLKDVTMRARSVATDVRLRSSELQGASITVTNMGDRGSDTVFGVIYPPQVAIIGLGKILKVPQVVNDNISIGEQLTISLSADHRVIDGMLAGKFLNALAKKIQNPERL